MEKLWNQFNESYSPKIREELHRFWRGNFKRIQNLRGRVKEESLDFLVREVEKYPLRILGRGKLYRPGYVLMGFFIRDKDFSLENFVSNSDTYLQSIAKPAIAPEILHGSTLTLDDVQDESESRRKSPSCWYSAREFYFQIFPRGLGEARLFKDRASRIAASLAADVSYMMLALSSIPILDSDFPERAKLRAVRELNLAAARIAAGQNDDLTAENLEIKELSKMKELWERIVINKTCALYEASIGIGSILAGNPENFTRKLKLIARRCASLFQKADDRLDLMEEEITGKPKYQDIREGKINYPLIIAYENASPMERSKLEKLLRSEKSEEVVREIGELESKYLHVFDQRLKEEAQEIKEDILNLRANEDVKDIWIDWVDQQILRRR